jgi:hypothetical protein
MLGELVAQEFAQHRGIGKLFARFSFEGPEQNRGLEQHETPFSRNSQMTTCTVNKVDGHQFPLGNG